MIYYSLRSKSLNHFNMPFKASSDEEAQLAIRNAVMVGEDASLVKFAADLELHAVATFSNSTGFTVESRKVCDVVDIPGVVLSEV